MGRADRYRWVAPVYDLVSGEPVYRRGRRLALGMLGLRPGERVLDVGCGTGLNHEGVRTAIGAGGRLVGLDSSPQMLARARARGLATELVQADAAAVDPVELVALAGGRFDAVLATYSLSLMPHWPAAWERVLAVAAPGARLAVVDMQRPVGRSVALDRLARAACALGGADIEAHPWTAVERDCDRVRSASAVGGHIQVRVGVRRSGPGS
ncbi:class I SAM-dependent methyltransferase [Auraticoccus monumenti]|uniref:Methyltransferase domain-containing protein n=1 Tax=Auraticoccus monumenti TaxID=675864 RepID=A0A1G6YVG0_9ACTN|nr:methyltransferase [Auraticoccus monumenti]SDD94262.1 Methyltransferase domain-containing protein [Auraticoccus monumenti]